MAENENLSEELEEELNEETAENADELDEADAASEYNDSAAQFADLEDALAEEKDKYLRLFAEYDNYRLVPVPLMDDVVARIVTICKERDLGHILIKS